MCSVDALPDTTVSFRGGRVTIDLTYPEEAHANTNITHYLTITSSVVATLRNFTVVIKAPVDSAWQEIFNAQDTFSKSLPLSYNLTLWLPQEANGMLQCFIFVNTSSIDDLSTTFYTTLVSEPTFSEMFANYTILQADYETLLNEYNGLLANYSSLVANYTTLLSEHNELLADYNSQVATYQALLNNYNKLSDDYEALNSDYRSKINEHSTLQSDYNNLNSTRNNLLESYNTLQDFYDALNQTYVDLQTDSNNLQKRITELESALNSDQIVMLIFIITLAALIAFIIYIKRKKQEPYVIIRKETVSMEPDETS